jgi:hypothetical protein
MTPCATTVPEPRMPTTDQPTPIPGTAARDAVTQTKAA